MGRWVSSRLAVYGCATVPRATPLLHLFGLCVCIVVSFVPSAVPVLSIMISHSVRRALAFAPTWGTALLLPTVHSWETVSSHAILMAPRVALSTTLSHPCNGSDLPSSHLPPIRLFSTDP
ncbi:hypothetical protein BC628DRAFT_1065115 [Trametes gibbosa]|nr:hypothetical protein BC628DRAFT_1065115 [Trametes gibbosa]